MSLVESHEKRVTRVKMFFHMLFTGAFVCLLLYAAIFFGYLHIINKRFVSAGFPKSIFPHYVENKYIWIPLSRFKKSYTDVEPIFQKVARQKRLPVITYNRLIDAVFGRAKNNPGAHLLQNSLNDTQQYIRNFKFFFPIFLGAYILLFSLTSMFGKKHKHIRGTRLMPHSLFRLKLKRICLRDRHKNIRIGKLPIPYINEVSHFLFMGATRSGKSVTLNQMIHSILERKKNAAPAHKLIIYDLKGEYVSKWYTKHDILFFPFDTRSVNYSLFNEIRSDIDFKIIAKSLFEPPRNVSQNLSFFYEAGGEVFKTGLVILSKEGKKRNRDILEFFTQDRGKLIDHFKKLPKALQGPIEYLVDSREAAGVLSTIHEKINFLEYMTDSDGSFSFRDYISDRKESRNLFIPNISNYKNIFMPLFSFGIDIMIKEVLSLPDDFSRRIFFLIDEFSSLHTIQSIFDFQRESGSKGGSLICAMQDLGDLGRNYGQDRLQSFFNNFHTKFIFQLFDPGTQDYASRALGERQVYLRMPSHQYSPKDIGDRESISLQNTNERIVLPSEFGLLKKLECYVQLSNRGTSREKIPRKFFETNSPYFMKKEFRIDFDLGNPEADKGVDSDDKKSREIPDDRVIDKSDVGDSFSDDFL